ncbi:LysR substrate-binding domain-containing protein, partial [Streptococcus suis]
HKWDIIIYIGHLADSSLKMVSLAPNNRFVCASPEYLSRYGQPETPHDIKKHQCISLRENNEDVTLWSFTHKVSGSIENVRIRPSL